MPVANLPPAGRRSRRHARDGANASTTCTFRNIRAGRYCVGGASTGWRAARTGSSLRRRPGANGRARTCGTRAATALAIALVLAGCDRRAETAWKAAHHCLAPPQASDATAARTAADGFPALTGRVVDAAEVLPPRTVARLTEATAVLERATRHQLAVATVPSLSGRTIEAYSLALARRWGLGRACVNDGVLLLVAPSERKVRIEVGYGLEKALPDEETARILQRDVLPAFRAGDVPGGIERGVNDIVGDLTPHRKAA